MFTAICSLIESICLFLRLGKKSPSRPLLKFDLTARQGKRLEVEEGMEDVAVYMCNEMEELVLPPGVQWLCVEACGSLKRLVLPPGIKILRVFDCDGIEEILMSEGIETLEVSGCSALTELLVPDSVRVLGVYKCQNLKRLNMPQALDQLHLQKCTLKEVHVPKNATALTFHDCGELVDLTFGSKVKTLEMTDCQVGRLDFSGVAEEVTIKHCHELEAVVLPGVQRIKANECLRLKSIAVRAGEVETVDCFHCWGLEELHLPAAVGLLEVGGCTRLRQLNLESVRQLGTFGSGVTYLKVKSPEMYLSMGCRCILHG